MFLIHCPHCGLRNASEFRHAGERRERPDPRTATPTQWRSYLYERRNVADWSAETWYHGFGCRKFIGVERHTLTNEVRSAAVSVDGATPSTGSGGASVSDSGAPDAAGAS